MNGRPEHFLKKNMLLSVDRYSHVVYNVNKINVLNNRRNTFLCNKIELKSFKDMIMYTGEDKSFKRNNIKKILHCE